MPSSRLINPTTPGGLLSPSEGNELTPSEELVVQQIAAGNYFVENEVPSGDVDGVNTVFTLANAANPTTSVEVWLDGVKMKPGGVDYTFSGDDTITFVTAPLVGSLLLVNYRRDPN